MKVLVVRFSSIGDIVLTTIPADQPPFCMLSFNNQSTDSQLIKVKTIDSIDILLMDEANTLLDFNNVNWTITLKLEIIRFKPDVLSTFKEILNGGSAPHTDTHEKEGLETLVSNKEVNKKLNQIWCITLQMGVVARSFHRDLVQ